MTTVKEEMPLAAAVADEMLPFTCSSCFFLNENRERLQACARCLVIYYCGTDCQKKDWHIHKAECKYLKKCPAAPDVDIRLFCRIMILRAAGSLPVADNGRSWDGLTDHKTEILSNQDYFNMFRRINTFLDSIRSDVDVPEQEELISIFGKIRINSFEITGGKFMLIVGSALYVGLAAHDHSCAPDCYVVFNGAKAILRSPRENVIYSTDLTITYTDLMVSTAGRQEALKKSHFFDCKCTVCMDPARDQWGRSAYAACCPDGVCPLDPQAEALSCNRCGTRSPLKPTEVENANLELEQFMKKRNINFGPRRGNLQLQLWSNMKIRMDTILSPLNFLMVKFREEMLDLAVIEGDFKKASELAVDVRPYKHYLSRGNTELTKRLIEAANSKRGPLTGQTLEIIQEAYKATLLSHGSGHPLTTMMGGRLSECQMRLQLQATTLTEESSSKKEGSSSKKEGKKHRKSTNGKKGH